MSTADARVNIVSKRLIGFTDFGTRFLDYLRDQTRDAYGSVYQDDVVLGAQLGMVGNGADAFDVTGSSITTDGDGNVIDPTAATADLAAVPFENTSAISYFVALKSVDLKEGIQINPRTGKPEYVKITEIIGDSADPDSVVDNGGSISFVIDGLLEAGVDHSGRQVVVQLKQPADNAITEPIAIETLSVTFSGGSNRLTTAGVFGQLAVSTTPSDYVVTLRGPVVKRNTDLRTISGTVFVGIITGNGGTPVSFDLADQNVIGGSLSQLGEITRIDSHGFMKIEVKADPSDSGEPQISVKDSGGSTVFSVDEAGNVVVQGTTTQQDVVTVNSSETITDNLTAGDADAIDSHLIKGTWRHTNTAGSANYFKVDGTTGQVGINADFETGFGLKVGGQTKFIGDVEIETAEPQLLCDETDVASTSGGLWRWRLASGNLIWDENTAAGADFSTKIQWMATDRIGNSMLYGSHVSPLADDTWDLGLSGFQWRNLHIDGTANIDVLSLSTATSEGLGSDMLPDADAVHDLGSVSRRFAETHTRTLILDNTTGFGVGSNITPTVDNSFNIGTATRRWANLFAVNLNFTGDFLPVTDNTQDVGSPSLRWAEGHFVNIAVNGVSGNWVPDVTGTGELGTTARQWGTGEVANSFNVGTAGTPPNGTLIRAIATDPQASSVGLVRAQGVWNAAQSIGVSGFNASLQTGHTTGTWTGTIDGVLGFVRSGATATTTGHISGLTGQIQADAGGTISTASALYAKINAITDVTVAYGLLVDPISGAGTNWSIFTNAGPVHFGDSGEVAGNWTPATTATYELGTISRQWASAQFSDHIEIGTATAPPTDTLLQIARSTPGGTFLNVVGSFTTATTTVTRGILSTITLGHASGVNSGDAIGILGRARITSAGATWTVVGVRGEVDAAGAGSVADVAALHAQAVNLSAVSTAYGLLIDSVNGAGTNWSIFTNTGPVHFGDSGEVAGNWNPSVTNTHNLGIASLRWDKAWINRLHVQDIARAQLIKNTTQLFTSSWAAISNYVVEEFTSAGVTVNLSTGFITLTRTGMYSVWYTVPIGAFGTSGNVAQARVQVNGTGSGSLSSRSRCGINSAVGKNAIVGRYIGSFTAGDTIRLQIQERTSADAPPGAHSTAGDASTNSRADIAFGCMMLTEL